MSQTFSKIVVDGFESGETDFSAALRREPPALQEEVAAMMSSLVEAEVAPEDGVFWSVTLVGASDRYDVAGASAEERRAKEREASYQRCQSAAKFLIDELAVGMTAAGLTPPTSVEDPANVGIGFVIQGSADLVHPAPSSESQRQKNRRLIRLNKFTS